VAVINLTWDEIDHLVDGLASRLPAGSCCWGVPRGGSVVAALLRSNHGITITADWTKATIAVDDIIDSGRTAQQVWKRQGLRVEPLMVKENTDWIVFPWEGNELSEDAEHTVTRFLEQIGEDPNRPELEQMPRRVVNFWEKLFSGYRYGESDIVELLWKESPSPQPAARENDLIVLPGIYYISSCEKHLLPFHGVAHVGYMPDRKQGPPGDVSTVVDVLSRRLQMQERLTQQICSVLEDRTDGAAVLVEGNYVCPLVKGSKNGNGRQAIRETSAFTGRFRENMELQDRFLRLSRQSSGA
jgi:GTP cyclohydrolase I